MNAFTDITEVLRRIIDLGGPVVAILIGMSVITGAVTLYKLWQYRAAGVGRHLVLSEAMGIWDSGEARAASRRLDDSRSYLAPMIASAMRGKGGKHLPDRLTAEAGAAFERLESGFRILDSIAQLAPLLGLFGTVLGMIDAFQALQNAGSSVDPSILAGGIWVALMTTAVGLAVAMPTSLILTWFESRMAKERAFAELALSTILAPRGEAQTAEVPAGVPAYAG
ncbi:MotA/TolQ/ExbB proton channel family protein [Algicella marina]|uniref:MotA/TolQ/ExbB proton channel family protein n=1 Tax=Algicella marina TaxID=2683284 RepID=A0A6P1T038_9RHOB|nr:MotA/TolQ/ExbB proton channel family protein [Algicella marina]QHQ35145.1 MotA/TolQ/ExbB proton channel family protein [Algicella marina]